MEEAVELSTPIPLGSDLRRRTILKNAVNISPLRKSLNLDTSLNKSLLDVTNDDNDERSNRRNHQEIQKRLLNLSPSHTSLNESYIKEQFIVCTHLFSENKITSKNVWKLQIIDMLKPLCQRKKEDTLQIASTSIDISAKVYGIRVDDVHSEGLKLANSMARTSARAAAQEGDEDDEENEGVEEATNVRKNKSRKIKKINYSGPKSTVARNSKANISSLPKLEPIDFSTRVNAETGTMENLFTNSFKECCSSFVLLDKTETLYEKEDTTINTNNRTPFSTLEPIPDKITSINVPFKDFRLGEWDPDNEEKEIDIEKSMLSQLQPVVFDDDGLPIPELDGSIHDIFENNDSDADDDLTNDDNDIQSIHEFGAPQLRDNDIAHITDFKAADDTAQTSEYSYNTILNTRTGKFIDQIWAGPHHWKLKFLRRSAVRFSGQQRSITSSKEHKQARKRAEPEPIDFTKHVEVDFSKKLVIKRKAPTVDINKITLPLLDPLCARMLGKINELMLKPGVCPVKKKVKKDSEANNLDYELNPYKYENPNDSLYCSQYHDDDNGALDGGHTGNDVEVEEHIVREEQQAYNLAEHLVENPEMVQQSYVPYVMRAKQMDMKKLKGAVWQYLTNTANTLIDKETQKRHGQVIQTTFSELYKGLPQLLLEKECKELSCSLAFVALLHLCNEQNLELTQIYTYKDFHIKGPY